MLMRDILTMGENPDTIMRWTQIAQEEAERV